SLFTFGIVGGLPAGKAFYDALKLFKRLVNMGDAKSLACHPASTTHRQMSAQEQEKAGVRPEMIRLSVGIEHIDDIVADLDQALGAAQSRRTDLRARAKSCRTRPEGRRGGGRARACGRSRLPLSVRGDRRCTGRGSIGRGGPARLRR